MKRNITARILPAALICLLGHAALVLAQETAPAAAPAPPGNVLSANNRFLYRMLKAVMLRSAEKMPEESYGFKPTGAVRTFGQIVGDVAESQYLFCSEVLGEKNPAPEEKSKPSKADRIAALKSAFAYCDKAYEGMTDASAAEMMKHMGIDMPRLGVLTANNLHTVEHYGNIAIYLRMKNIVPPTNEPEFMQQLMK
jgi:uncharacterized damage-inducible protein DinB